MTELNARNGQTPPKGGVLLGAKGGREMRLTIPRADYEKLTIIANVNSVGQTEMLEAMVANALEIGWSQLLVGKMLFVLANWITWAHF